MTSGALDLARRLVAADLVGYEAALDEALEPQRAHLGASRAALYGQGKRLRPLLLLLAARVGPAHREGPLPPKVPRAAVALEMLHVATLIHDDIVDGAARRRGAPSLHAERGLHAALLLGDLQFVQAIRCFAGAVEAPADMGLVRTVLDVGFQICCGELDELAADPGQEPALLRGRYWATIERKTAVLFGLALEVGAALARADLATVERLGRFGRAFGRAFQVMDDLQDLTGDGRDKPRCADLRHGRLTLPIVGALDEVGREGPLGRVLRGDRTEATLEAAREQVLSSRAFLLAYADARAQALDASAALDELPPSPQREALRRLADELVDEGPPGLS